MSHDQKCFDLAEHFLPTAPAHIKGALAEEVQAVIEGFLQTFSGDDREPEMSPLPPPSSQASR